MIRRFVAAVIFLVFFARGTALWAADFDSDGYGSIADYLRDIYGADNNAGLSAFPVLNIPMGGRAEGMAGSFSAVADDASFIEYNPAGSSMLKKSELAFFHNNWIADTKLEGAVFTFRLGDLGLAAGGKWLYTPFTEYNIFGDRVSKGYYSEAAAMLNLSYNFFSGYYFSGISAGLNLKGAFRFVPDFTDSDDTENSQGQLVSGSGASQSAAMAMADIGLLTRFDLLKFYNSRERNFSLALVCRNLGPLSMDEPLPTAAGAGVSWKPLRPILFSFDYIVPLNLQDLSLSEKPYWAGGISAAVTEFLSMRAGLQSKTGNVRITVGSAITMEKLSLELNYTLDLLTELRPLSRVSLGLRFDLGDRGRQQLADQVDDLYLAGLDAYALEQFDEARTLWEEALVLDPRFDPARESLNILHRTVELRERIDEMQRLNF